MAYYPDYTSVIINKNSACRRARIYIRGQNPYVGILFIKNNRIGCYLTHSDRACCTIRCSDGNNRNSHSRCRNTSELRHLNLLNSLLIKALKIYGYYAQIRVDVRILDTCRISLSVGKSNPHISRIVKNVRGRNYKKLFSVVCDYQSGCGIVVLI